MGSRHPNPRLVKIHRRYSVEDVSRLFRIHKNTVRNWLNQGMGRIDDQRPILILGRELARFLTARRNSAKQKCGPGRIYCLPCRAPKSPAGNIADCVPSSLKAGSLCGICPDCSVAQPRQLDAIGQHDRLGKTQGPGHDASPLRQSFVDREGPAPGPAAAKCSTVKPAK
jgi:hypothetical protein